MLNSNLTTGMIHIIWDSEKFHITKPPESYLSNIIDPHEHALGYDEGRGRFVRYQGGRWHNIGRKQAEQHLQMHVEAGDWPEAADSCLSFVSDDGSIADHRKLGPLARDGVPFTLAITRDFLNRSKRDDAMSAEEVAEMIGWGCEVAGHGLTHRPLHRMDQATMRHEIQESINHLRQHGWKASSFAYPFGACNSKVRRVIWELGLAACLANGGASLGILDRTAVPRVAMGSFTSPDLRTAEQYKKLVDEVHQQSGLLVFMLHPEESQHDDDQQNALCDVIDHARQIGMRIVSFSEGVSMHAPLWQAPPQPLYHWVLTREGKFTRAWNGGSPARAFKRWLTNESPLRNLIWKLRMTIARLRGRKSRNEI